MIRYARVSYKATGTQLEPRHVRATDYASRRALMQGVGCANPRLICGGSEVDWNFSRVVPGVPIRENVGAQRSESRSRPLEVVIPGTLDLADSGNADFAPGLGIRFPLFRFIIEQRTGSRLPSRQPNADSIDSKSAGSLRAIDRNRTVDRMRLASRHGPIAKAIKVHQDRSSVENSAVPVSPIEFASCLGVEEEEEEQVADIPTEKAVGTTTWPGFAAKPARVTKSSFSLDEAEADEAEEKVEENEGGRTGKRRRWDFDRALASAESSRRPERTSPRKKGSVLARPRRVQRRYVAHVTYADWPRRGPSASVWAFSGRVSPAACVQLKRGISGMMQHGIVERGALSLATRIFW